MKELEQKTFGPVYATSSKGDIKMWSAQIEETLVATRITYTYGLDAGKKQVQKVIKRPPLKGKKNKRHVITESLSKTPNLNCNSAS